LVSDGAIDIALSFKCDVHKCIVKTFIKNYEDEKARYVEIMKEDLNSDIGRINKET